MKSIRANLPVQQRAYRSRTGLSPTTPLSAPPEKLVQVISVTNNLPYSCIAEIKRSKEVDAVHYAIVAADDKRLIYRVVPENNIIPSFSIYDLDTSDREVMLVVWPVIDGVEGEPVYSGPIALHTGRKLGTYDLEVDLKGEDLALFKKIKPLIEKYYGKAALPGMVKIQPDTHDVYIPDHNVIHLSPSKHNFIHELLHANRKQLLFANKNFHFDETTEILEEFFSEGVSNLIKDELAADTDGLVYGSTLGYNYDFRIEDNALITQNLQSTWGGIRTLENSRYFLGSEAFHKIAMEYQLLTGRFFGKDFNKLYYEHVEKHMMNPDRELFFSLCEHLVPVVEGTPFREWIAKQKLFYCTNIPGEKLFMAIRDYYTSDDWLGVGRINFYETFPNGSDWIDGDKKYNKNGALVNIQVVRMHDGKVCYQEDQPIGDLQDGFGHIQLYFPTKENTPVLNHFTQYDDIAQRNYAVIPVEAGLYEIILTAGTHRKRYYRILGDIMVHHRDQLILATPLHGLNTTAQVTHRTISGKETILDPQPFHNRLCILTAPFIQNKNCEPGFLTIVIDDGFQQTTIQRNIGYGGDYGGHQFWLGELVNAMDDLIV